LSQFLSLRFCPLRLIPSNMNYSFRLLFHRSLRPEPAKSAYRNEAGM
jgi:hypothetical protein